MIDSGMQEFTILFLIPMRNAVAGASGVPMAAMDIGWAQEAFGMRGRLSSVQVLLDDPAEAETVRQRLERRLRRRTRRSRGRASGACRSRRCWAHSNSI